MDAGTAEEDYTEMYFRSLNIIEKKDIEPDMALIMIVFTNQEDVSDEQAEQYVKWSEEGKRPDDIEIYYFLNLRYGLMSGDDELKYWMKWREQQTEWLCTGSQRISQIHISGGIHRRS